jgi:hypothetical protein
MADQVVAAAARAPEIMVQVALATRHLSAHPKEITEAMALETVRHH